MEEKEDEEDKADEVEVEEEEGGRSAPVALGAVVVAVSPGIGSQKEGSKERGGEESKKEETMEERSMVFVFTVTVKLDDVAGLSIQRMPQDCRG